MKKADLLQLILPEEIFTYFNLEKIKDDTGNLCFYLEEINTIPAEFSGRKLESNGFHSTSVIKDFPLRGKPVFLYVRRRRWKDLDSGLSVSRDWNAVAGGTHYTQDFAAFLKELSRQSPGSRPVDFESFPFR
jgi:hypothetical protein